MRRDPDTPNGLTEFLVVPRRSALLRERGIEEISLNFATAARFMHSPSNPDRAADRPARQAASTASSRSRACTASTPSSSPAGSRATAVYEGRLGLPRMLPRRDVGRGTAAASRGPPGGALAVAPPVAGAKPGSPADASRATATEMPDGPTQFTAADAAGAGLLMLAVNLVCAGIGAGLGALVGALVPGLLVGFGVGFGLGIRVIIKRFRAS